MTTTDETQAAREARREHLRAEIHRCNVAIEGGDSDPWWREDRMRFEQELRELDEPRKPAAAFSARSADDGAGEPFGYWVEQKHADPVLLRKPAYIPEPSDLRTVTPLYAAPRPAVSREAVARLIEPRSWTLHDNAIAKAKNLDGEILGSVAAHYERDYARRCVAPSLAKADDILQLLQEQGEGR